MSKVTRGFLWSAIERFSVQGISFILGILIARIVSPESYGLLVMIQVFISISQVFIDGGFANALIQKIDRDDKDYSTAFVFNIVISIFLYLFIFCSSPFIAEFYNEPKLELLTKIISVNLIISSVSIVQKTKLTIELNFKVQAKVSLISVIISGGVALVLAYNGLEIWALVVQAILNQTLQSCLLLYLSHWRPNLYFSLSSFKLLFGFGSKLLLANIITNLYINVYNIVIGKKYSSTQLAYFNRAFTLVQFPSTNIESILNRIIYPIECMLQNDKDKLISAFYRYLHLSMLLTMPIMTFLVVMVKPIVLFALTDKWLPVTSYVTILSFNFIWFPLLDQLDMLMNIIGKTQITLKSVIIRRVVSFGILILSLPFGIYGICWGLVIGMIVEVGISYYYVKSYFNISLVKLYKVLCDVFALCIILYLMLLACIFMTKSIILQIILGSVMSPLLILFVAKAFKMEEYYIVIDYLKKWK